MKVWCEKCKGSGDKEYDWENGEVVKTCDVCGGDGYTEPNKPTTEINIDYYEELKAKADRYDGFKVIIDMTESVITKNANSKLPIPIIRYSDFLKLKEKS